MRPSSEFEAFDERRAKRSGTQEYQVKDEAKY
jgi:hypothetical protein